MAEPREFRVLGPVEAVLDGRLVALTGKQRTLLSVLLLSANRVVSVERLAEAIWGRPAPAAPTTRVRTLISESRRAFGDVGGELLVTRAPGYLIVAEAGCVDLETFLVMVDLARAAADGGRAEAAVEHYQRALALWQGPALGGASGAFIEMEAARLAELRIRAVEDCAELTIGLGRHADVVADLTRWTAEQPLRERLHAQLMIALHRGNRRGEALEVFRGLRKRLVEELGLEPSARIQQLQRQILSADPAIELGRGIGALARPRHVPTELPNDLADFTGRVAHVERLAGLLSSAGVCDGTATATSRGVVSSVVSGIGGIGKTTLAVHAAQRARPQFPDGQLYVDLRGTHQDPLEPGEVLARFLRSLGVPGDAVPVDVDERAAAFRSRLADRRILILLDDARDAAQVRPLLPGTPGCAVLVTSRRRLTGLDASRHLDLDVLTDAEARELFTQIVDAEHVASPSGGSDPDDALEEVLRSCAGLPLAIRIAAARLSAQPTWTVRTLADRLAAQERLLDELTVDDRAVRTSFALSYRLLPPDEAKAFQLLGCCEGPTITTRSAAALLGRTGQEAQRVLDGLAAVHLLTAVDVDRYRFHDLVKTFAAECAAAELARAERDEAVRRVLIWYLHSAVAVHSQLSRSPLRFDVPTDELAAPLPALDSRALSIDWCEAELPNLVAATGQAARDGDLEIAWKLPAALRAFHLVHKHWAEWIATNLIGVASAERLGDAVGQGLLLNNLSIAYQDLHRFDEALGCLNRALVLHRQAGDRLGELFVLVNVGVLHDRLGQHAAAEERYNAARVVNRDIGDRAIEAALSLNLGVAYRGLGRIDDAAAVTADAAQLYRDIGDPAQEGVALSNLADLRLLADDRPGAIAAYGRALRILAEAGHRHESATALIGLGNALNHRALTDEGRACWTDAQAVLDDIGDPRADGVRRQLSAVTAVTAAVTATATAGRVFIDVHSG
jgi:DNA-binding SARP family transcriptional activator/tetratricopeptide (TPR) repeat protein